MTKARKSCTFEQFDFLAGSFQVKPLQMEGRAITLKIAATGATQFWLAINAI